MKWRRENKVKSSLWKGEKRKDMRIDELILERKRQRLLSSSDPAEVEEGKAIVTPTSIFQEFSTTPDFEAESAMEGQGPGDASLKRTHVDVEDDVEPVIPPAVDDEPSHIPNTFELRVGGKKRSNYRQQFYIWLPLVFPSVPKKVCLPVSMVLGSANRYLG